MFKKKWINKMKFNNESNKIRMISDKLGIPFLTSKILLSRGYDTVDLAEKFINPDISDLNDPFLFVEMEKIVNRIEKAIINNENIWIYGDYDVDGITSVSILINYFKSIGYDVNYYIPNRQNEGYGIGKTGIDYIFNKQGNLIISVDCGITANEMADYSNQLNMDIIITDHHTCGDIIPNAFGILNPKVSHDTYPYDMLAGVGIAFKLIQALSKATFKEIYMKYIDITAFGTIADIAPLDKENHIITRIGLEKLKNTENLGMKALIELSKLNDKEITAGIVGFRLAPQINAAGRLGDADLAVKLLTSSDKEEVYSIAEKLKNLNEQRKMIEKAIFVKSKKYIEKEIDLDNESVIVVFGEQWHSGVIGIVASRIVEKYGKPAIVLTREDDYVKGSARSVGNFNIYQAIKACEEFLIGFGGHKMAAGLSLKEENVINFRKSINEYVKNNVDLEDLISTINYEGDILSDDITLNTINSLDYLKPFGVGNPKPSFRVEDCDIINIKTVGSDKSHLKLIINKNSTNFDTIGFGFGYLTTEIKNKDKVDLLVNLDINEYNGLITPQLMLKDMKMCEIRKENILEIEYFKTLFISIKNNITYFNNINFNNLLIQKDSIKDIDLRTLILVNSIHSISNEDKKKYEKWKFHFNVVDKITDKDILINPILKNIKINDYEQIIFYDIPIRKKIDKLISFANHSRIENLKNIFREIPDKGEIIKVYRKILNVNDFNIKNISKLIEMSEVKALFALEILKEIKIIDFKYIGDNINIIILPKSEKTIKIEENLIFIKLLELKGKVM